MANDVEIVKRGYLKYKLCSSYPQNGMLTSFKEYWFVFRMGTNTTGRLLDMYNSEKEGAKKTSTPKERIFLRDMHSVTKSGNQQILLHSNDGSIHYLETRNTDEWMFALNAVLFGKGPNGRHVIQFVVHIWSCPKFNYYGSGLLEIREDQMIVWSKGEKDEVVRWNLGHIRSFKAKPNLLEIVAGSRSSTGQGVFLFGTQESVLITHTLETVIDRLAKQKRAKIAKAQQALPPIPQVILPPLPAPYKGTATMIRDSPHLVPGFSDVPGMIGLELSLQVNSQGYDQINVHSSGTRTLRCESPSQLPDPVQISMTSSYDSKSPYDKLDHVSSVRLSCVELDKPTSDIYLDELTISRKTSQNISSYSYVDTAPQLVPLPTDDRSSDENVDLGEVRRLPSPITTKKSIVTSGTNLAVLSNGDVYSTINDSQYSSLNPVNLTSELPQGMYNQLKFKNQDEVASTGISRNDYEQVYTNSSQEDERDLFDSRGSVEIKLEEIDQHYERSPVLTRKHISPRVSPHQSPTTERRTIVNEYDDVSLPEDHIIQTNTTVDGYSRFNRTTNTSSNATTKSSTRGDYEKLNEEYIYSTVQPKKKQLPLQLFPYNGDSTLLSPYEDVPPNPPAPYRGDFPPTPPAPYRGDVPPTPPAPYRGDFPPTLPAPYRGDFPPTPPVPYRGDFPPTLSAPYRGDVPSTQNDDYSLAFPPIPPSAKLPPPIYQDDIPNALYNPDPDIKCHNPASKSNTKNVSGPPVPPRRGGLSLRSPSPKIPLIPPSKPKPYKPAQ